MNIYQFMSESPVLTFFLVMGVVWGVVIIINRIMRHLNIRKHGYPPPHCDADGDLREEKDEEAE